MNTIFFNTTVETHQNKLKRLAYLITGFLGEKLTNEEHDELDEWVGSCDKNMKLFEELTDPNRIKKAYDLLYAENGE
jgi:hypothetical protein